MRAMTRVVRAHLSVWVAALVTALIGAVLVVTPAHAAVVETSVDGIYYEVDDSLPSAGATVRGYDTTPDGVISIPAEVTIGATTYPVTTIGDYAFRKQKLTAVTIPDSVTTIGKESFATNSLTTIDIPDSVTTIGKGAFFGNHLESATLSNQLSEIPAELFYSNQLTSIDIPDSVTTIGESAFGFNHLAAVAIPSGVSTIGDQAFAVNDLTSVTVPDGITAIGYATFFRNDLTNVHLPDSVTGIGDFAFGNNQLTTFSIPESVTAIGDYAFQLNKLTSVTIPTSVTAIGVSSFVANNLTTITIPAGITSIPTSAFDSNPALKSVRLLGAAPTVVDGTTSGESFDTASGSLVLSYGPGFGVTGGFTKPTWHGYHTVVDSSILSLTGPATAAGHLGQSFTYAPKIGGVPVPTVTLDAGALPPGLHLNATTGAITGTPTTMGSYPITLKAANGSAPDATRDVTITIGPGGINDLDPTITGDPREGKTLTAHHGAFSPSSAKLTYKWKADGVAISKATKSTLKLGSAQAGRRITVSIKGTATGMASKTETSDLTEIVSSATPRIVVSAKTVHAGDTFTVTAVGLKPGRAAAIWLNGVNVWKWYSDPRGVVQQVVSFGPDTAPGARLVRVSGYRPPDDVYRDFTITTTVAYVVP